MLIELKRMEELESEQLIVEGYKTYIVPSYRKIRLVVDRGEGAYLWDIKGKRYLDFTGGIAVNLLGHAHPAVREALARQSEKMIHCSNLFYHPQALQLARKIVSHVGPGKVFFSNSGAEANECLFKVARRYGQKTGRFEILSFENSFHGRTLAGISATGQPKVKKDFGPLCPGFRTIPKGEPKDFIDSLSDKTIALIVEPIQGESGIHVFSPGYLKEIRRICRDKDILFFIDEIQSGLWRTGRFLAWQSLVEEDSQGQTFLPDGVSLAKGLGGGFPIGASWVAERYSEVLDQGSHGSTFGGSPLACHVALSVLEEIEKKEWGKHILEVGNYLVRSLKEFENKPQSLLKEIRGIGGILGLELTLPSYEAVEVLMEKGLLVAPANTNTIRLLPPLNVSFEQAEEARVILEKFLIS
ncbi:acetylornithine/succinylornithine family transaminase [Candidatus Methylacidiphilum infernorum]|uniref:Acetylornithine/succinylornithine family transaminase n=2 Tax=Candidatus Methylacidiphilum infernorum TaxID=511746 RepID=A0ABX7PXD8_9BACT|nr:acetylornithine/succinylornithine family transaminase [Candidatus Methylacidiphilum infernorum]